MFPCTGLWAALDLFIFPECDGNPFVRILGSLFLISANVELSVSLVTLRQAPLRKKKEGEEAVEDECGVGARRISACETQAERNS